MSSVVLVVERGDLAAELTELIGSGKLRATAGPIRVVVAPERNEDGVYIHKRDFEDGKPPSIVHATDPEGQQHQFQGANQMSRYLGISRTSVFDAMRTGKPISRGRAEGWTITHRET